MNNIIRTEVQVTPKIDLLGNKTYAWRIYQITDGIEINLESGFEEEFLTASNKAYNNGRKYI